MKAMILEKAGTPLIMQEVPEPKIKDNFLLIRVLVCGVCRTDLHIIDGELEEPKLPLILGHQVIGIVEEIGKGVTGFSVGERVGIPWLGGCCGHCDYCIHEKENLCDEALFTGYQVNGGYAEYCIADPRFCFPIPDQFPTIQAAPLLCAGLIGYRSYRMCGDAKKIGFYGFGASAHILAQLAKYEGREVYAFTRKGDTQAQELAKRLGAVWVGDSEESPPQQLDAAIIFAPVGSLVPTALRALKKGGSVVCAGIHMSDIPSFPYSILWGERIIRSVANLTRRDGVEFLEIAPRVPIQTEVKTYPLERANEALNDLRSGRLSGAAVLIVDQSAI
ncbi:MAG: zinc-dependent alcohol dehydrogenase family protein [Chlamydiia bacterium]|nr:zinc-dependent alcohol dehydrogenase family protein [Chlamydiia bacterium]